MHKRPLHLGLAQLGAPKAITATAYKLAKIIYFKLHSCQQYVDTNSQYYESQNRERVLQAAKQRDLPASLDSRRLRCRSSTARTLRPLTVFVIR